MACPAAKFDDIPVIYRRHAEARAIFTVGVVRVVSQVSQVTA